MNEQEIVYGMLETIRSFEITDDEKVTEGIIRHYLNAYRASIIKNLFNINEDCYQNIDLTFTKQDNIYVSSDIAGVIYDRDRIGISIYDFNSMVSLVGKEEALNARRSRMFVPPYIAWMNNGKVYISIQEDALKKLHSSRSYLKNLLNNGRSLEIQCILSDPSKGKDYQWDKTPYPLSQNVIQDVRKNILRQEFGITIEVKKDEIQNGRQDNIIYQDESKLYK